VLLPEDGAGFILDDDSEAGCSSRTERFTGAIEPGKDSWFF
jgi:hypothetical protein